MSSPYASWSFLDFDWMMMTRLDNCVYSTSYVIACEYIHLHVMFAVPHYQRLFILDALQWNKAKKNWYRTGAQFQLIVISTSA